MVPLDIITTVRQTEYLYKIMNGGDNIIQKTVKSIPYWKKN